MTDVIGAFLRGKEVDSAADEVPEGVDGPSLSLAQQLFEFGEGHLDRIEIRAVGRQEQEASAGAGDEARGGFILMARQVVEDHGVAFAQHRDEDLLDIGEEALGVDRPIEYKGRDQPLAGQAGKEGRRLPVSVRRMAQGTCPDVGPGVTTRHRRRRPGLVKEDEPTAKAGLRAPPLLPALNDVGTILFAGVHGFF